MIDLETNDRGVILPVKAHAGARCNEVRGHQNGMLKVSVSQAPEKGKANKAIVGLLAKVLSLRKSQITLLSGETSTRKLFLIAGVTREELELRLQPLLAE